MGRFASAAQLGIPSPFFPIVASAESRCAAQVWDPRTQDPVLSLEPVEGETPAECWTVAFGNSYNDAERCIAAGHMT